MRGAIRRHSSASASRALPDSIRLTSSTSLASISIIHILSVTGRLFITHPGCQRGPVLTESARYPKENADDRTRATTLRKHEKRFGNQIPGNTDPHEVHRRKHERSIRVDGALECTAGLCFAVSHAPSRR